MGNAGSRSRAHRRAATAAALVATLVLGAGCTIIIVPKASSTATSGTTGARDVVAGACPLSVSVTGSGTYCGVNTVVAPWAPPDAEWDGASFQSEAGHGPSHNIEITFGVPVASVEVTAYDPTYPGNAMIAYNVSGAAIGGAEFPGSGTPGVFSAQTRTVNGAISRVMLIAAPRDYLNYSMRVQYGRVR